MKQLKKIIDAHQEQINIREDLIENQKNLIANQIKIISLQKEQKKYLERRIDTLNLIVNKSVKMIIGQEELICFMKDTMGLDDDIIATNYETLDNVKDMLNDVGIDYK